MESLWICVSTWIEWESQNASYMIIEPVPKMREKYFRLVDIDYSTCMTFMNRFENRQVVSIYVK